MNPDYIPHLRAKSPVPPGAFVFAAAHLDHPHIYDQCRGLIAAGGTLAWVYDSQPDRIAVFRKEFPQAREARSLDEILNDPVIRLITAAAVPCDRGTIG